jgi:hypothetical protein
MPTYFMTIGIAHPHDVTLKKDYSVSVQWNFLNTTRTKTLQEFSMNGTRTWVEDNNHSHFFDKCYSSQRG